MSTIEFESFIHDKLKVGTIFVANEQAVPKDSAAQSWILEKLKEDFGYQAGMTVEDLRSKVKGAEATQANQRQAAEQRTPEGVNDADIASRMDAFTEEYLEARTAPQQQSSETLELTPPPEEELENIKRELDSTQEQKVEETEGKTALDKIAKKVETIILQKKNYSNEIAREVLLEAGSSNTSTEQAYRFI